MNSEMRAKRFESLKDDLEVTYALILGILAALPVPLTPVTREDSPVHGIHALSRCWVLADSEPLSPISRSHLKALITEWLTAYELAVAASEHGPGLWRINGIEAALMRASARISYMHSYFEEQA